jgi:hypothetical protein
VKVIQDSFIFINSFNLVIMNTKSILFLSTFICSAALVQAQKTDTTVTAKAIVKDSAEKTQTVSLTEYGINAHIDIPIIEGYEPIIHNTSKKKENKILIVVSAAFRLYIEAKPTTFSDAEIYLAATKKADIDLWFHQNPADPQPIMIINEPNAYLMKRGKEYKLAYIVTIDNVRYTITSANYIVYDLDDALRYIRLAKTFFPK